MVYEGSSMDFLHRITIRDNKLYTVSGSKRARLFDSSNNGEDTNQPFHGSLVLMTTLKGLLRGTRSSFARLRLFV